LNAARQRKKVSRSRPHPALFYRRAFDGGEATICGTLFSRKAGKPGGAMGGGSRIPTALKNGVGRRRRFVTLIRSISASGSAALAFSCIRDKIN